MNLYVKRVTLILSSFAVSYAVIFLIGAFVSASWDLASWSSSLRMFLGLLGNLYALALMMKLEHEHG